jgi:hypothetical protein
VVNMAKADGQIYNEIFIDYDKMQVYDMTTGKSEAIRRYVDGQKDKNISNYMRANSRILKNRRPPRISVMYLNEGKII